MFMTKGRIQEGQISKECAIEHVPSGRKMKYDEKTQMLYFSGDGTFTTFPSKQRAISARHHGIATEKAAGAIAEWKEIYRVVEL